MHRPTHHDDRLYAILLLAVLMGLPLSLLVSTTLPGPPPADQNAAGAAATVPSA